MNCKQSIRSLSLEWKITPVLSHSFKSTLAFSSINLNKVNYPVVGNYSNLYSISNRKYCINCNIFCFFWKPCCLSSSHVAYLNVWSHAVRSDWPLPAPLSTAVYSQILYSTTHSRLTDYIWFRAQTDSVQATINTAAIISASSNLPTLEPDDVKKITAQWLGLREMEGIQSPSFIPGLSDKKLILSLWSRYYSFSTLYVTESWHDGKKREKKRSLMS